MVQREPLAAALVRCLAENLNPDAALLPEGTPERERHDRAVSVIEQARTAETEKEHE